MTDGEFIVAVGVAFLAMCIYVFDTPDRPRITVQGLLMCLACGWLGALTIEAIVAL